MILFWLNLTGINCTMLNISRYYIGMHIFFCFVTKKILYSQMMLFTWLMTTNVPNSCSMKVVKSTPAVIEMYKVVHGSTDSLMIVYCPPHAFFSRCLDFLTQKEETLSKLPRLLLQWFVG